MSSWCMISSYIIDDHCQWLDLKNLNVQRSNNMNKIFQDDFQFQQVTELLLVEFQV